MIWERENKGVEFRERQLKRVKNKVEVVNWVEWRRWKEKHKIYAENSSWDKSFYYRRSWTQTHKFKSIMERIIASSLESLLENVISHYIRFEDWNLPHFHTRHQWMNEKGKFLSTSQIEVRREWVVQSLTAQN